MRLAKLGVVLGSAAAVAIACGGSTQNAVEPASEEAELSKSETDDSQAPTNADRELEEKNKRHDAQKAQLDFPAAGASTDRIMEAHFKDALLIREAVIAGRSEEAAKPATVLANIHDLQGIPPEWKTQVEHMQETARRVADGTTAAKTAAAAADLGVSCGLCHQQHGGPKPIWEPAPTGGSTVQDRMQHHIWAAERLWDGLSVPSDKAWKLGAEALTMDPFPKEFLKTGGVDVRAAAADFAKLGAAASKKSTTSERAALYAELLITCGSCHHAIEEKK